MTSASSTRVQESSLYYTKPTFTAQSLITNDHSIPTTAEALRRPRNHIHMGCTMASAVVILHLTVSQCCCHAGWESQASLTQRLALNLVLLTNLPTR